MHRPQTDAERVLHELRLEGAGSLRKIAGDPASSPRLALATVAWLGWVFALCYVVLPLAGWLAGARPFPDLVGRSLVAWAAASVIVAFAILVTAPRVRSDAGRDPVLAATAGGLVAWALAESALPFFRPFTDFAAADLAWFALQNLVEMALLGVVWASLTRRAWVAFAVGAGFQLLVTGLVATLLAF